MFGGQDHDAALAVLRRGRDPAGLIDGCAGHGHRAAIAAVTAARLEAAGDAYAPADPAAEHDPAIAKADRIGPDRARHIDRIAQDSRRGRRLERDHAAIGDDLAVVGYERPAIDAFDLAEVLGRHRDRQKAVARQIERDQLAAAERDLAEPRRDGAVVRHLATEQRGEAAVGDVDAPGIGDRRRIAVAGELVVPRHEVGILDVEGGGRERTGVDHAVFGDGDAVGIDQQHRARRVDGAGDGRRRITGDAVQRRGGRARLIEIDGATLPDRERMPVEDGAV